MESQKEGILSCDGWTLQFDQCVPITYELQRFMKDGVDTISCVGIVDLSGFGSKAKEITVCNIQLAYADAIKFGDQFKDFCEKSDPPQPENGLSDGVKGESGAD